jgi:flagellar M-ring protein FliF
MAELAPTQSATPPMAMPGGSQLERVRSFTAQPVVKRVLPWFLGLATIGGAALAFATLAPAPQRVLYSELGDAERASVASSLDKAGIAYSINPDTGTLTVGEDDLYKARMLVASDGALAVPDPVSSLDSLPLGASRTLEGERLRGARQGELEMTIKQIDGVESVRVHLAEASKSVFVRDDAPPTASVMVRMAKGRKLADGQVSAIVNLVAGSVPGLSPDAVRVVDQHGRLLSDPRAQGSDRLDLQARLEDKLRTQLEQLLTPMLGAGNFTSEIQVELDMDEVTSAREAYDKTGVVRSETSQQSQAAGTQPGQAVGVPGALSNTPPPATQATPGPPQPGPVQGAPGAAQTSGESSASRTYELGREVSVANSQPGKIKRVSVAVAISQGAMKKAKPGDLEQIKALVSAAAGIDPARGDQVQVMTRPFEPISAEVPPFWEAPWFAMVVRSLAALLAVLLVLLLGVRPLVRAMKRDPGAAVNRSASDDPASPATPAIADAALLGRQVNLAQRIVEEKPDDALLALRQMLGNASTEPAR